MTIQFSTKIFPQADLQSPKLQKSSLKSLLGHNTDCLVLAYSKADFDSFSGAKGAKAKTGFLPELDLLLGGSVNHANVVGDLDPKQASVCMLRAEKSWSASGVKAKRVLLVALGDVHLASERSLTTYSKVARAALKVLSGGSIESALWFTPSFALAHKSDFIAEEVRLTVQYAGDQAYRFGVRQPAMKFKAKDKADTFKQLVFAGNDDCAKELKAAVEQGVAMVEGMNLAKDLGNLPPNICTPTYLGKTAQGLSKKAGLKVEVLGRKQIEALGMGSFLSVAKGSDTPPQFIVMRHQGGKAGEAPIVLVGKGITFDTGGLNIKTSGMLHMKCDMAGGAAVFGAMQLIADLQLPVKVTAIVPCAENSVDAKSFVPSDVIHSYSGHSIEIIDTDAEGRLVLADGLSYLITNYKPEYIIDIATLTGSSVGTFGYECAALFTNNDEVSKKLQESGDAIGERLWPLPLWEAYKSDIESDIADVKNYSGKPVAGAISAAKFLEYFTESHKAWAHLDIAGVAWKGGKDKGATGRPVGLLLHWLLSL